MTQWLGNAWDVSAGLGAELRAGLKARPYGRCCGGLEDGRRRNDGWVPPSPELRSRVRYMPCGLSFSSLGFAFFSFSFCFGGGFLAGSLFGFAPGGGAGLLGSVLGAGLFSGFAAGGLLLLAGGRFAFAGGGAGLFSGFAIGGRFAAGGGFAGRAAGAGGAAGGAGRLAALAGGGVLCAGGVTGLAAGATRTPGRPADDGAGVIVLSWATAMGLPPLALMALCCAAKLGGGGGGCLLATTAREATAAGGRARAGAAAPEPITLRGSGATPGPAAGPILALAITAGSTFTMLRPTGWALVKAAWEVAVTAPRFT
jgi:hypothetical protein